MLIGNDLFISHQGLSMPNDGISDKNTQKYADQLFSSILIEQQKFCHIAPPDPLKSQKMIELLNNYEDLKGRESFYNYLSTGRGHGPFTQLQDDSIKYDLICGIGVGILGHSHPLSIKAHLQAACSDIIMCGNLLTYPDAITLTETLLKCVHKSALQHFWFAGSGSFSNDLALKIIWQKSAPRYKILALEKAFAGRSVATQNITANPAYRVNMPTSIDVVHVPSFDYICPEKALNKTMDALNKAWNADPTNFCTLMLELVQGEAGFIQGHREYYKALCKWGKEKNLFIWIDEVQTFARTTELFAFQMFDLDRYVDVVTVGKALQACGTFYTHELNPKPGLIAGTFNGSLVSLKAGNKIVNYLTAGDFYGPHGKIKRLETIFISKLKELSKGSCRNKIGRIGGCGTMIFFELTPPDKEITIKFIKLLFENGVIVFMGGSHPTRVRFLLPVCLTPEHIQEIFLIIEKSILQLYQEL